ncbi:hypothetical protein EW146_g3457 [Bondarzewia mesenterica]|uniref:Smr domain-containing protein n=1 Tax=Bondarzewia mesenterica TaxID=1095465 RepID=A0A4S4LXI0_9AGAM|nr:hypothetical protein EW146_g3457 [Bondarzewia mesenterica]
MYLLASTFLLLASVLSVLAVDTTTCDTLHNGLRTGTLEFTSDCNVTTWCNNGSCVPKGCRKDEFPLGWPDNINMPTRCNSSSFCPDEESECIPKLTVGSSCQFNRDDECLGPDNFKDLRDESGMGLNVNGSLCLDFVCQWANVTVGQTCEVENTGYIAYASGGQEFIDIVSRDNCKIGTYCDSQQKVCIQQKNLAVSCSADKECLSYNCGVDGTCGKDPREPRHLGTWVYIVIAIAIFGGMFATLFTLFFFHRRQRDTERDKRLQYWREQNAFRQNIMQMRDTARASIFSVQGGSMRSTVYSREGTLTEDLQAPLVQHAATKSSGLRHYVSDDGSFSYENENEGLVMTPRKTMGIFDDIVRSLAKILCGGPESESQQQQQQQPYSTYPQISQQPQPHPIASYPPQPQYQQPLPHQQQQPYYPPQQQQPYFPPPQQQQQQKPHHPQPQKPAEPKPYHKPHKQSQGQGQEQAASQVSPSHPASPPPTSPPRTDQNQVNQQNPHYTELRARANEAGDAMARAFEESHQVYAGGNGARAKELSNLGKEKQREMERLNKEASEWIFRDQSIQEARQRGDAVIHLIVGKGLHSTNGAAKLRPAIEDLMRKYDLTATLDPNNGGVLIVELPSVGVPKERELGAELGAEDITRRLGGEEGCVIISNLYLALDVYIILVFVIFHSAHVAASPNGARLRHPQDPEDLNTIDSSAR